MKSSEKILHEMYAVIKTQQQLNSKLFDIFQALSKHTRELTRELNKKEQES
jgi:HD superfamily phosphohydrolase YqeK